MEGEALTGGKCGTCCGPDTAVFGPEEVVDQYVGGAAGRQAEIESGAGRTAAELVEDIRRTNEAVDEICARMPTEAWSRMTRSVTGSEAPASYVASPSTRTYTSASTSANIRRTTLPFPGRLTLRTIAPASRARSAVWSLERLSYT